MSLNIIPLEIRRAVCPELNIRDGSKRTYNVADCGLDVSVQEFSCNNVSNSTCPFKTDPQSSSTVIDPDVRLRNQYEVTLNVLAIGVMPALALKGGVLTSATPVELDSQEDAPRSWSTHSCLNTIDCKINGQSMTTDPKEYIHAFERIQNFKHDQDSKFSTFPSMPDAFQDYITGAGSNRNPLASYGNNPAQMSRGSWLLDEVSINTPTQAKFKFTVEEPVLCSPFFYNKTGLVNIKTLSWVFNYGALDRVWSHLNGDGISYHTLNGAIGVNITSSILIFRYLTPKLLDKIPRNVVYSYSEILHLEQTDGGGALAPNSSRTLTISAINLSAIPKRVVINVRQTNDTLNSTSSDTFAQLTSVSVNWNSKTNQFSNMAPYDLYLLSRRNGLAMSYQEFNKYCGGVFVLDPAKDIGLKELESDGVLATPQFSCKVTFLNPSVVSKTYVLNAHVVYEGTVTIVDGLVNKSINVLTAEDVKKSLMPDAPLSVYKENHDWMGSGSFWDDLWSGIKQGAESVYNVAKDVLPIAEKVAPYLLPLVGLGDGGELEDHENRSYGTNAYPPRGGSVSSAGSVISAGGKRMSRSDLKRQMKMMVN